ncbi:dynamin family protein [Aquibacillus kalidii]|uniref:dynamin family protein n=1 Tax=Aquibacillus kalidii TaxID=2762597 RepID=UPI0016472B63|nr:dynamin family protein [Aquibacillus kalidii]
MTISETRAIHPENIAKLFERFQALDENIQAQKALDLLEKIDKCEYSICFSGHFSAGKSSLINYLIDDDVLPQSPIPTSANLVKVTSGNDFVRVFFHEEAPIQLSGPYNNNLVQSYCKNGDTVKKVEISKKECSIPNNVAILDTPGIDSANDADRIMTESSLHTVDVLFYVMDYNHVQSEVNLNFIKDMQSKGVPVYVIINQIDKHNESELTFSDYKGKITETFTAWGINPIKVYFTSLKSTLLTHNQINALKSEIDQLMSFDESLIKESVKNATNKLVEAQINKFKDEFSSEREALEAKREQIEDGGRIQDEHFLKKRLHDIEAERNKLYQSYKEVVSSTLNNAYIMPFEIRDLAKSFLESVQPGFKLGLFSSKKKIEAEKDRRLEEFYQELSKQVQANMEWKLREKLTNFIKDLNLDDTSVLSTIQALTIHFPKEQLIHLIKDGAKLTGEYILVYTDDIANQLKQLYRQKTVECWEQISMILNKRLREEQASIQAELDQIDKLRELNYELSKLDEWLVQESNKLYDVLQSNQSNIEILEKARDQIKKRSESKIKKGSLDTTQTNQDSRDGAEGKQFPMSQAKHSKSASQTVLDLEEAITILEGISGFQAIQSDLKKNSLNIKNKKYTVALFGAFSAGKSSFANALIGSNILPSSPNPTTATINKISPPTETNPHGTVLVQLKDQPMILKDIQPLIDTSIVDYSLERAFDYVSNHKQSLDEKSRGLIDALVAGYSSVNRKLGSCISASLDQFSKYVTEESLACYVESIELFYDSPITRQGISLVDTPGADSINARHTSVAFDYIKEADAILYITYYNHAFSKADREFLIQLGRVKDSFSLDKMFFIVNAADLAQDKKELELVTKYVTEQLQEYGVKTPRMYAVSSKKAMESRINRIQNLDDGIDHFEKDFHYFIKEELMEIMINSSYYNLERASHLLGKYIESASLNNEEKHQLILNNEHYEAQIQQAIEQIPSDSMEEEINQKLSKQLFYVDQRNTIQFSDRFKEAFNPSTIKSNNGREAKEELKNCVKDILKTIGFDLAQEMRAVSLRLEKFINQKGKEFHHIIETRCQSMQQDIELAQLSDFSFTSPEFEDAFVHLSVSEFNKAIGIFKNTKSFFEKNEKEVMKEMMFSILEPHIKDYLDSNKQIIKHQYMDQWHELIELVRKQSKTTVEHYYESLTYSLSEQVDINLLKNKQVQLKNLLQKSY